MAQNTAVLARRTGFSSRLRLVAVTSALLLAAPLALAACAPDPIERRAELIWQISESLSDRLELTDEQASCIREGLKGMSDGELEEAAGDAPSAQVQERIVAIGVSCYRPA